MPAPWLAVLAQAIAKQQQDAAARKQTASGMQQRYAAEQGAPTYQMEAAQLQANQRDQAGPDYLSAILPMFNKGG